MPRNWIVLIASLVLSACAIGGYVPDEPTPVPTTVTLRVVDESGTPIGSAAFVAAGGPTAQAVDGAIEFAITQPTAGLVRADGYLDEPVVVGGGVDDLQVEMWEETGADGTPRFALHFAGDTMMGRRYLEPTRSDTAVVSAGDGGSSAAEVVAAVATIFAAADVSMLNLESVVGGAPIEEAAAGKRFLLQSPPEIIDALAALGVDVVTLGNNHAADWGDEGIAATLDHLDQAGILATGAGPDDASARIPALFEAGDTEVAVLSYTTVTGSPVNDELPTSEDPRPARIGFDQTWEYEARPFSYVDGNHRLQGDLLAGDVWQWFKALDVDGDVETGIWREMIAMYPELQDWVARRGHGGAAWFRRSAVESDVGHAREAGVDLVIVQIHGGYQFSDVGSTYFVDASRAAVDAGADMVVGHHPHVLQGFEWHDGSLIVHSLGNFVFDQDFSSTFSSMILRTIHEGDRLLEARVLPVVLSDYRPAMATGPAARSILRELRADSTGIAPAEKVGGVVVRNVDANPGPGADLVVSGNAGVVVAGISPRTAEVQMGSDGIGLVDDLVLVGSDSVPVSDAVGRDLLRWGSFDDVLADGAAIGGANWSLAGSRRVELAPTGDGGNDLAIRLEPTRTSSALVRPVARIPVPRHRFADSNGTWVDGEPDYAIRARIRRDGPVTPTVRLDLYHFDDSDPLSDPESELLDRIEVPIQYEGPAGEWVTVETLVPAGSFDPVNGVAPNAAMIYLTLEAGTPTTVEIDDLQLIEWRRASDLPEGLWLEVDVIRSTEPTVTLTVK